MSDITRFDYIDEIEAICKNIAEEMYDEQEWCSYDEYVDAANERVHEVVDGHQWVIYYAYNLQVLMHSDNDEAMIEELGEESAGHVLRENGLNGLHSALAFWAMYRDVMDDLGDELERHWDEQHEDGAE